MKHNHIFTHRSIRDLVEVHEECDGYCTSSRKPLYPPQGIESNIPFPKEHIIYIFNHILNKYPTEAEVGISLFVKVSQRLGGSSQRYGNHHMPTRNHPYPPQSPTAVNLILRYWSSVLSGKHILIDQIPSWSWSKTISIPSYIYIYKYTLYEGGKKTSCAHNKPFESTTMSQGYQSANIRV